MELTPVLYDAQDPRHEQYIPAIASIHAACITADRTIMNFHFPLSHAKIVFWWRERAAEPDRAVIVCLAGGAGAGEVVGVVTLRMPSSETEPFKGLVEKLLVSPARRRAGVAHILMRKLEDVARENGKSMLLLDTETGSPAEAIYPNWGYIKVGIIPDYDLSPDGKLRDETFFYKDLRKSSPL